MPIWAFMAMAIGAIGVVAVVITLFNVARTALEKRALLQLLVQAENVEAGARTLSELIGQLADAEDEVLEHFADDHDAVERRVLQELAQRLGVTADELDMMPLPAHLVPVGSALADAAYLISTEAGRIREDDRGDDVLVHVGEVDLAAVKGYAGKARGMIHAACLEYGLEDTAVYGGGLYL